MRICETEIRLIISGTPLRGEACRPLLEALKKDGYETQGNQGSSSLPFYTIKKDGNLIGIIDGSVIKINSSRKGAKELSEYLSQLEIEDSS